MAYFAGNAVYIGHVIDRFQPYASYLNTCGSGVRISANTFEGNIGLKKHNGGAIVQRCIIINDKNLYTSLYYDQSKTSSVPLEERPRTDADTGDFEFYYEDAAT